MNAHHKPLQPVDKPAMIVEKVFAEEATTQPKQNEEEMSVIEKRIAEQKKRVNPFKKSAVVSTTWEVRESKRNRQKAKNERVEGKRKEKMKEKEEAKLNRLKGM